MPSGLAIVYGRNAQGKTNLLEAIYYLATSKSFRAGSDREIINWLALSQEPAYARLVGRCQRRAGLVELEVAVRLDRGARVCCRAVSVLVGNALPAPWGGGRGYRVRPDR